MKAGFIILALYASFYSSDQYRKILCSHPWRVDYIKTLRGTGDPLSTNHTSEIDSMPPLCGQIVTFKNNNTCEVKNKGRGFWSEIDKYNWSLDDEGNIRFRNTDPRLQDTFILVRLSIDNDSVIFYTESRGIEAGIKLLRVHKLGRVQ